MNEYLTKNGFGAWFYDVSPVDIDCFDKMEKGFKECNVFTPLITDNLIKRYQKEPITNIKREMNESMQQENKGRLIRIVLSFVDMRELPMFWSDCQRVECKDKPVDNIFRDFERLMRAARLPAL